MRIKLSSSLLTWLRCFDAAARHSSFTLAASDLHVTQGAVSQQVRNLEEWLGVLLFKRGHRKLELSDEGLRLKLAVKESFQILESTLDQIRTHDKETALSLNCSPSFAMRWLSPRMGHLLREYPDLAMRVYGEFHMLDRLRMEQDGIEAAIRFDPGEYGDVRVVEFLDEWLIPVTSAAVLAEHPEWKSPADLGAAYMLHDASPWARAAECEEWNNWHSAMGLPIPEDYSGQRFNMSQLALSAALSGQGVALGRLALVLDDLVSGRLVPVFKQAIPSKASYHFVSAQQARPWVGLIERWLVREGAQFTTQRNAWCRKAGVMLKPVSVTHGARKRLPTALKD
ncbi:LysR family transcriptional regulator [Variovorax sp. M-6]|uniref:LysR family transcriptional regulator n=1 Tax=Variovorax sp. M-6 TaxID=3233041 RepID=UPI003F94D90F